MPASSVYLTYYQDEPIQLSSWLWINRDTNRVERPTSINSLQITDLSSQNQSYGFW